MATETPQPPAPNRYEATWWRLTPKTLALMGLLALLGVVVLGSTWLQQFRQGLGVTGMNQTALWGLYVVNFIFLIGLSAGGVIVASGVYVWNATRFKPLARIAEILSITCLLMAMVFIMLDLGRPDRFMNLLLYPQIQSPLIWDFIVITIYLLIAGGLLLLSARRDIAYASQLQVSGMDMARKTFFNVASGLLGKLSPARAEKMLRYLAMAALPGAVLIHSVTAWILGLVKAHPDWHTAILAPLFIISALISGIALLLVVAILCRRFQRLPIPDESITGLGKILGWTIPVAFYFSFAELLTTIYGQEPAHVHTLEVMTVGAYAPVFWFSMVVGLLVPFLILIVPKTRTVAGVGIASTLVVLGVFAKRVDILLPPLMHRFLPYPPGVYLPTQVEWTLMASVWAFGALVFLAISKIIPLAEVAGETK
ncbi:MAG: polysulfide reductase NrfD [Euryarchaeota archaeon]|nr:polysulfide reductase NrfD [Euryarchaeota archaeon]